jgi:hypothetical protein
MGLPPTSQVSSQECDDLRALERGQNHDFAEQFTDDR